MITETQKEKKQYGLRNMKQRIKDKDPTSKDIMNASLWSKMFWQVGPNH